MGGYPMPVKTKKSKKQKVKDLAAKVGTAYVMHKAAKKAKFLSPMGFGHGGFGYGGYGGYGGFGGFGRGMGYSGFGHGFGGKALAGGLMGMGAAKVGKKLLGAYIKLKIAKYALEFGAEAAKAYFYYKMGLTLDEYMIGKFVHRYHQHRVRGDPRWRYYHHHARHSRKGNDTEQDDITLGGY